MVPNPETYLVGLASVANLINAVASDSFPFRNAC
jgi:hypothetical protein